MNFYEGNLVCLRGLTADDCRASYLQFVNDAEALCYVEGIGYRPLSQEDLKAYVAASASSGQVLFGIFAKDSNEHVGNIHLSTIKPYHNNCVLGIVMSRHQAGKGYAFEACMLALKHAFEAMNMHRVQFSVVVDNQPAVRLYEKIGGTREGILRQSFYHNGRYLDMAVYAILQPEYFAMKSAQHA